MVGEPAVFLFHRDEKFWGAVMVHVDDIIGTGEDSFMEEIMGGLLLRFKISKDQEGKFTYSGMTV